MQGPEDGLNRFKYEVARDLGLDDEIQQKGWGDMTTREAGKIGGEMVRRMISLAEDRLGESSREASPHEERSE